MTVIHL